MNEHKRIELLMLFVKLAETLSFTKAANELGISKGHLSEKIKQLEQHLKTPLLIRTTRSVRLTQHGEQAFKQGLAIRSSLFALERNLNNEQVEGVLRLTAPKMFARTFLVDICHQFKLRHPNIEFEINASFRTHNLNHQDFDLAFRATATPPENMVAHKLFNYQHPIVCAPQYLQNSAALNTLDDLKKHACLTVQGQALWPFKSRSVKVKSWLSSNDNQVLKQHAVKGDGLLRIANYFIEQELATGELVKVLEHEQLVGKGAIYLLYPQTVYPPLKLKAFIEFVKEYFR